MPQWTAQLGTIFYPKHLPNLKTVRFGDVVTSNGALYISRTEGADSKDLANELLWYKLEYGSFLYPKILNSGIYLLPNDILLDIASSTYLIYKGSSKITLWNVSNSQWKTSNLEIFNYKTDWMKLLRPMIGNRRLGDLILPGSHDSGSWAINKGSALVDYQQLYVLAITNGFAELISNWTKTQRVSLHPQLSAGFRNMDMRVADVNNEFFWWHEMASLPIVDGLKEIRNFSIEHPEEILILKFQHISAPGNLKQPELEMSKSRKTDLADLIFAHLGDRLVDKNKLSDNPTVNEVLNSTKNIILVMEDAYIRTNYSNVYWPEVIQSNYVAKTNPEDVFVDRSRVLNMYKTNSSLSNSMTDLSGCTTPGDVNVEGGLLLYVGLSQRPELVALLNQLLPFLRGVKPGLMSFEGLFLDLLSMATATNTVGMRSRPAMNYTNGASVHYGGVNEMLPYWLARPQLYKVNIIYVDDIGSSTIVDTAIKGNHGQIPRQVTIAFQGNARDGFLKWNGYQTTGGTDGLSCINILARYQITSATYALPDEDSWTDFVPKSTTSYSEGQYPLDARVVLQVAIDNQSWVTIFEDNIQNMISKTRDIYLRGSNQGNGTGFAYLSERYNVFGESCTTYPRNSADYFILINITTKGTTNERNIETLWYTVLIFKKNYSLQMLNRPVALLLKVIS